MPKVDAFLNPNSMLTPGIAGGLVASISMPIALNFGISIKWVILAVSILLGLFIVLSIEKLPSRLLRGVYCLLNSLIIFSMSLGVAVNVDTPPKPPVAPSAATEPVNRLSVAPLLGISAAEADDQNPRTALSVRPIPTSPPLNAKPSPTEQEWQQAEREQKEQAYVEQKRQYQEQMQQYNRRWSW